jgi:SAM-dependent methyltransferase
MNKEEILALFEERNANLQVPVEFQLALLGLNEETIKNLQGKTGLDIACGNGFLVEDLISKGILFEGIDFQAPKDKPYFIPQNITNVSPLIGSIPRDDNSYDIVTAFQCWSLNRGFTMGGVVRTAIETEENEGDDWHTTRYQHAQSTIYEATRVVKPGGKVIAYPALTRIEKIMGPFLHMQGINIYTEPVDKEVAKAYLKTETPDSIQLPADYHKIFGILERTILEKK